VRGGAPEHLTDDELPLLVDPAAAQPKQAAGEAVGNHIRTIEESRFRVAMAGWPLARTVTSRAYPKPIGRTRRTRWPIKWSPSSASHPRYRHPLSAPRHKGRCWEADSLTDLTAVSRCAFAKASRQDGIQRSDAELSRVGDTWIDAATSSVWMLTGRASVY
jgi:hypothetical protein